jgi:hypothetical protein
METNRNEHGGGFDRTVHEISIRGRLAIGLHCFTTACQRRGLVEHPEIQLFLDQMWQLVALQGTGFAKWERANPLLIHAGLGDDFPPGFTPFLASKGVDNTEFRELLANLVEVVYDGAYGAANNQKTLDFLMTVVEHARKWGGRCPEPMRFAKSRWTDRGGWGHDISVAELEEWRYSAEPK